MQIDLAAMDLDSLEKSLVTALDAVRTRSDLELIKRDWLSKDGHLKTLFRQLREVPDESRAKVASKLNSLKERLEQFIETSEKNFESESLDQSLKQEFVDLSLPGYFPGPGRIHPITLIERKIMGVLRPFGFRAVMGPEIETEYFCFDSLNIPKHHPARDMQDTFYTESGHVLRTHTTSVQARTLQKGGLPIKIACFGRTYRNETEDASHSAMFHQFDLVWLDEGLTLSNLMALIQHILKELYGKRRKVRFVPKFYPYTEPSIGALVSTDSGWVTVGGAGMIHRKVLVEFGYNPEKVSGFAFGLGTTRLAAEAFELERVKQLYENDLRVL